MRIVSLLGVALAAALLFSGPAAAPAEEEKGEEKGGDVFFNGKDLTGWEGIDKFWSVKDGAIVGFTPEDPGFNTFLATKKKYGDFEMKFKVRLKGGVGNSGVQVRSKLVDTKKYTVHGPQADIGQGYWGSLYGEGFGGMMQQSPGDLVKKAVKPDDFNDYYIKCVGKHVTIKINGETMVDQDFDQAWADKGKGRMVMPDDGVIALQLHAGFKSMEVTFKDIEFKDLSKK